MNFESSFSSKLLQARKEQGLTQQQTAEALHISLRWYQKIEKGESVPSFRLSCNIVKLFDIDLADFVED